MAAKYWQDKKWQFFNIRLTNVALTLRSGWSLNAEAIVILPSSDWQPPTLYHVSHNDGRKLMVSQAQPLNDHIDGKVTGKRKVFRN